MFIETILAYIVMILPAAITIISSIIKDALSNGKLNKIVKEVRTQLFEQEDRVKELSAALKEEKTAKLKFEKAATLAYEELRRIHQAHPEWIEGEDEQ